jgi:hypothetical protein
MIQTEVPRWIAFALEIQSHNAGSTVDSLAKRPLTTLRAITKHLSLPVMGRNQK